jgi:hypothetical protein
MIRRVIGTTANGHLNYRCLSVETDDAQTYERVARAWAHDWKDVRTVPAGSGPIHGLVTVPSADSLRRLLDAYEGAES